MSRFTLSPLVLVIATFAFYTWPFDFRIPSDYLPNGATPGARGGLDFQRAGIVLDPTGGELLYSRLAGGKGVTVAVAIASTKRRQAGPARIVSMSLDPWHRNLTLGQVDDTLLFRIRTRKSGENGIIPELFGAGVFRARKEQLLVVTYDGARARLFVDGEIVEDRPVTAGPFDGWDPTYPVIFGNEATELRPWFGHISDVAIYDTAFDPARVADLTVAAIAAPSTDLVYSLSARCLSHGVEPSDDPDIRTLGHCRIPAQLRNRHDVELFTPKWRSASDYLHGVFIWLPLSYLAVRHALTGNGGLILMALGAWVALLESLQVFLLQRSSSLIDLLTALAAIVAGGLIARRRARLAGP